MENQKMKREALSHIDVLIVGAGLGGLYAAIECYRLGHSPRVIESKPEVEALGQCSFAHIRNPQGTDRVIDRGLCRHRALCDQPVQEMARHARDLQQHHLSTSDELAHT